MMAYRHAASLESNKRVDLFDGPGEELNEENVLLASCKSQYFLLTFLFFSFWEQMGVLSWLRILVEFPIVKRSNLPMNYTRRAKSIKFYFLVKFAPELSLKGQIKPSLVKI